MTQETSTRIVSPCCGQSLSRPVPGEGPWSCDDCHAEVPYDLDLLLDLVGPIAVREFLAAAETYRDDLFAWAQTLRDLDDRPFQDAAEAAIHSSSLVASFRGNWNHEHFKCSAVYAESERRREAAGHDESCMVTTLYDRAHNRVARDNGYSRMASPVRACTCGATT